MDNNFEAAMCEYRDYTELFFTQVFDMITFQSHAPEANYSEYIDLANTRLFDFKTWYEHSKNEAFPENWSDSSEMKFLRRP